jgi:hypothetical protein
MEPIYYIKLLQRYRNAQLTKDELVELFDWFNSPLEKLKKKAHIKTRPVFRFYDLRKYVAFLAAMVVSGADVRISQQSNPHYI